MSGRGRPAKRPSLPIGNSDWAEVKAGYWSADKPQLISGLLDRKTTVARFTRPRRFGKTFALDKGDFAMRVNIIQTTEDANGQQQFVSDIVPTAGCGVSLG